jgi:tetrahydromethanopterin S-methyltransferase subunit G
VVLETLALDGRKIGRNVGLLFAEIGRSILTLSNIYRKWKIYSIKSSI